MRTRVCPLVALLAMFAAACAPVAWTTSGSTTFPQPLVPGCVSFVLQKNPGVDSAVVAAANPRTFGATRMQVGAAPTGPRFAEVRFAKASGTGTIQQFDTGGEIRVTTVWRWHARPVSDDSVRALETWLQAVVVTISSQCGGRPPADTLQFRHSWDSPS